MNGITNHSICTVIFCLFLFILLNSDSRYLPDCGSTYFPVDFLHIKKTRTHIVYLINCTRDDVLFPEIFTRNKHFNFVFFPNTFARHRVRVGNTEDYVYTTTTTTIKSVILFVCYCVRTRVFRPHVTSTRTTTAAVGFRVFLR